MRQTNLLSSKWAVALPSFTLFVVGAGLWACSPEFQTTCPEGTTQTAGGGDIDVACTRPSGQSGSGGAAGAAGGEMGAGSGGQGAGPSGAGQAGVSGGGSGGEVSGGEGGSAGGGGAAGAPTSEQVLFVRGSYSCVRDENVARCWGYNRYGQLAADSNIGTSTPNPTPALAGNGGLGAVRQLALGEMHSCALRGDRRVLCWGLNHTGQLGVSSNASTTSPNPTPALLADVLGAVRQLKLGEYHSCVLRDDGRVLCWGANRFGQLGTSVNVNVDAANTVPTLVDDSSLGVAQQLALGNGHSCALRADGRVLCWGDNAYGQLGNTANLGTINPAPLLVDGSNLDTVTQLALGTYHSCALRDDGRVLCWGNNRGGQLGISANASTNNANPTPTLLPNDALGVVRQIALGEDYSCALRDDGRVLCWGNNASGQLGTSVNVGVDSANPVPTLVDNANLGVARQLSLGEKHSCALRDDGRVLCWGSNASGQLGTSVNLGANTPNSAPALVQGLSPLTL